MPTHQGDLVCGPASSASGFGDMTNLEPHVLRAQERHSSFRPFGPYCSSSTCLSSFFWPSSQDLSPACSSPGIVGRERRSDACIERREPHSLFPQVGPHHGSRNVFATPKTLLRQLRLNRTVDVAYGTICSPFSSSTMSASTGQMAADSSRRPWSMSGVSS